MPCWIALQTCITTEPGQALLDEAALQRTVGRMALGFTPRVALVDEAVLLDVTGSLRLFGGLVRLMQRLEQQLLLFFESNSIPALIRRAQGATSLIALGRLRQVTGSNGQARTRVAELPMHTLSAAREHLGVLERVGCRNWDDLLRLPRDGMARRFGADLLEALDRARGSVPDTYDWLVLPEHFEEKLELNALVTHGPALMAGAERLLASLHAWLLGRQSGICALQLIWHLDPRRDVPLTGEMEVRTAQPAQDLRHVTRLIAEHLAQQKLPAPVHSLSLRSLATEKLVDAAAATTSLLMEARKQGDSAVELIERLSARLGETQVQAWQACADHRPEQMQRWVGAQGAIKSIAGGARIERARGKKRLQLSEETDTRTDALYPTWLLPEPVRLAAVGDSPVYQGPLVRLAGPQRLEASGWLMTKKGGSPSLGTAHAPHAVFSGFGGGLRQTDSANKPPAIRDYFIYRSQQGGLLWIFSERLPVSPAKTQAAQRQAWYLHGFFA